VILRRITPGNVVELERKLLARELLADVRWLDKRIPVAKQRLSQALAAPRARARWRLCGR
jgi:hypothetical protein